MLILIINPSGAVLVTTQEKLQNVFDETTFELIRVFTAYKNKGTTSEVPLDSIALYLLPDNYSHYKGKGMPELQIRLSLAIRYSFSSFRLTSPHAGPFGGTTEQNQHIQVTSCEGSDKHVHFCRLT